MKILLCHAYYQQRGGEDEVFENEADLLESYGHQVIRYTRHNNEITKLSRFAVFTKTIHNREVYEELRALLQRERPALVHCTNGFPLLSMAMYHAAQAEHVPVVQALHNYRLLCPGAALVRDGHVCEDCLGRPISWPGVLHGCYRHSRLATAGLAAAQYYDRRSQTRESAVRLYYAPSEFTRRKFINSGIPAERIGVKPNFVRVDPQPGSGRGGYAIFVGRLSDEKGLEVLLNAWERLEPAIPLKVIGTGPLEERLRQAAKQDRRIEVLGFRPTHEVFALIREAACLILPSICYETFGRTIIEAFATGTPVITSRLGAMAELVTHERTGLLFEPGNADDLKHAVAELLLRRDKLAVMRQAARCEYEDKYTAQVNYGQLLALYQRVLGQPLGRDEREQPIPKAA